MSYISPEIIEKVKAIDLKSYLEAFEPYELVRISDNEYCTRTHDSLKISNGKLMWWSRGIGGRNAVDYLVAVKNMSFLQAVKYICELTKSPPCACLSRPPPKPKEEPEKNLMLPPKVSDNDRIIRYLMSRGISRNIIDECILCGCIYESMPMHNVVFIGFDYEGEPKYGGMRGLSEPRFIGDVYGSDKRYTFRFDNAGKGSVHLFEGVIDLLSYATLIEMNGGDWKAHNLMTLSGVYSPKQFSTSSHLPVAIEEYIKAHPDLRTVYLHLDNDKAGRNAADFLSGMLRERFEVFNSPPPYGKDVNEYLCRRLSLPVRKKQERSDAR